ncbi:MAG TPA: MerR family DNA-binding transcriptional regulator [Burkholderiales bacterium]|nr:MerR family DNA-binding transcriptional regulator [Burkholderiales bacterium]
MTGYYSITALAKEFGVTTRTIRHYEDQGLLHPQRKGLARVFGALDRARLKLALRGKRLGLALQDIRELFRLYDAGQEDTQPLQQFLQKIQKYRAMLEQQREDVEVMLSEISFFAEQCSKRLASDSSASTVPQTEGDVNVRQNARGA